MNKRNNFAISTEGIINAMQSGGTVLHSYGIDMQETIALITGANKTLQDPSVTGNGLKSIAINMAGIKADAYTGEIALNKTALALKEIAGIDIFKDKQQTQIKDMVSIFDELYERWGDFNDPEQKALSEAIAGKQQSKVFQSLMSNYKDVLAVREQLANQDHFGSAERENEQYLDSISGKLNELKQTWIAILDTFANSESIKSALDVLISVSEGVETVVKALDDAGILLQTTFTAFTAGGSLLKNLAGFGETSYQIRQVGDSLQLVERQGSQSVKIFSGLRTAFTQGTTFSQKFGNSLTTVTSNIKAMGKGIASNLVPSLTSMLGAGLKGLAISAVFTGISWAVDKTINKYKNLDKELQSQASASKNQLESLNKQKSGLEALAEEYDKLAQKSKKTESELNRYNELRSQIAELSPELVIGYDENNNPILNLNSSLEDYIGNLETAIDRQKTLFANDSMEVGQNAIDGLGSSWNWDGVAEYKRDNLRLSEQNLEIVTQRQNLINKLNEINKEHNFKDIENELKSYAKQSEKYNEAIIDGHKKVKDQYNKIAEETLKAKEGMNAKLMDNSAMKKASEETKKLGSQMLSAFDLSEVDSNKLDQMVFNMSKNLTSGEFDTALKKVVELRQELEKTYDFEEYESSIEQYVPTVAKFLGVTEDVARGMLKVPEVMKSSEDALDEFLRSLGKSKQMLNFDIEAQRLAEQFYEVENVLSQLTNTSNLVKINGKLQFDPEVVMDMQNNESIPEQIRKLLGEFNTDGVVDVGEIRLLMDVITAFKLGNSQESHEILASVQQQLDEKLGSGKINITDLKFDVDGKVENVNIDDKELEKKLSALGDKKELKTLFKTEVIGLDKLDYYAEIVKNLPTNSTHTESFIIDNQDALSQLNSYKEVKEWIIHHPEVISTYKLNVQKDPELKKALEEFEKNNGKTSESTVKVKGEGLDEANEKLDKAVESKEELSKDVNLSVNNGELQGSVESFEKLIEYSTKLKDGTYSISFKSDTSESINQINNLKNAVNDLSGTFSSLPNITVKIETRLASQNVTGLKENIEGYNKLSNGLKTLVFNTDTTRASKNVTGLRNNVDRYIKERAGKNYSTKFSTQTALASQNVTGLTNKVAGYVKKYGGQTIKTTFSVVTKYSTQGTPTTQSKGTKVTGRSISEPYEAPQVGASSSVELGNQVQNDVLSTQSMARVGEGDSTQTTGVTPRVSTRATLQTPIAITGGDIYNSIKYDINLIKELENRIDSVSNSLSTLDKKMENAIGKEKIQYLQQQNILYQEQLKLQKELEDKLIRQKNYYKAYLEGKGVKFNADGNATNYEELLLKKEKELENLEKVANKENATDSQKNTYENAKNALDELNKIADEYFNVTFNELPKVQEEWNEINNSIKDNAESIKKLAREQELYTKNTKLKEVDMLMDEINDKQDLLNEKINGASEEDRVKYQNEYLELLKEENKLREEAIKQFESSLTIYQRELSSFGVEFNENGTIKNLDEVLNKYQHSESLEYLNELIEEYFSIQRDELPDARKEWESTKNEIDSTTEAVKNLKQEIADLYIDSKYKDHERDLAEVENKLAMNQIHLDNSSGKNYLEYLSQRISLTNQLKKETRDLLDWENSRRKSLMSELSQYGFNFREDGSIVGYGSKIEQLKNTLSEEEFEKVFGKIEEYIDTTYTKIPELQQKFEELGYTVSDYEDELKDLYRQRYLEPHVNKVKELENEYDKLSDSLDIVNIKLKHAWGEEKLNLLDKQIELLEKQKKKQSQLMKEYEKMASIYKEDLKKYGVNFDVSGDITNLDEILNKYQDHKDIEKLKELVDEYLELQRDKIPDVEKEWDSLNATIKDAYKEQLNVTKEIEDKILQVYKKQLEEKKKLIDEELDAKLKALKKEKDAYNKAREEADYKNNYEDQLGVVKDLEKQIEIAKKDTSLSGQKKLQELLKDLTEEQKKLEDIVQDKIDSDVNDMYDKESERLEEEADKLKENLDEQFSDERLQQIVKDALTNGVFVDIDGNVKDLQETLLEFEDKFGDGMTAIGSIIKSELVTNLEIAKESMRDLNSILGELDLEKFATSSYSLDMNMMRLASPMPVSNSNSVNFNSPLIVVEGNVDSNVVEELKSISKEIEENVVRNIVGAIR